MKKNILALLLAASAAFSATLTAYAGEVVSFVAVPSDSGRSSSQTANAPKAEAASPVQEERQMSGANGWQEPDGQQPETDRWQAPEPDWVDLEEFAQAVLELTNQERTGRGLSPLALDPTLTEMAMVRVRELEEAYSHTRPSGESCKTIFGEYETGLRFYGENAAKGQKTPEDAVKAWMDSDGHRENLLREGAQYLGVGVWQDAKGILYWEQLFAQNK